MLENKKDNEIKNEKKTKTSNKTTNENLFPPLIIESNRVKINVLIHNKYIFPKIGILGNESKPYYVGHTKPVTKIVFINQNILCSISQESLCIKMWDLNNFNAMCLKNIDVNFIIADLLLAKGNNIVVCGEKLIILDVETEEKIIIFQTSFGNYIEFNLLAKINDNLAAASSLGGYFLIFDLITGEKIKRIEMNKIHFICDSENKKKQIKNETPKKSENNNENNNENDIKDTIEKKEEIIPKIDVLKDIGSSKCLRTAKGHKGPVYCIIGLNNDLYEDCIISGGFDNLIKIFKIQEDNKVIDLVGHENTVTFLTLSDSKKFLLSSSFDFTIRKWDLDQCSCIKVIKYNPGIQNILLPMMNDFLLSVGYDGKVNIWNDEGFMVKNYYFQHGAITTGTLFPVKNDNERNMFVFADHTGEIFIKQIIVGDEDIKNFNKSRKKVEAKKISIRKSIKSKDKI